MAQMMSLANLAGGMSIGGSLLSGYGTLKQGNEQYAAAQFAADQLRQNAGQAEAAGQRDAAVQVRQEQRGAAVLSPWHDAALQYPVFEPGDSRYAARWPWRGRDR